MYDKFKNLKGTFKTAVAVIKIQIILTTVKTKLIIAIIAASFPMSQLYVGM
jgi:hypothetical protein